jgi:hypothetical protein
MPKYKVLKPVGWGGERQKVGTELSMEEAEAKNIGPEYLQLMDDEQITPQNEEAQAEAGSAEEVQADAQAPAEAPEADAEGTEEAAAEEPAAGTEEAQAEESAEEAEESSETEASEEAQAESTEDSQE